MTYTESTRPLHTCLPLVARRPSPAVRRPPRRRKHSRHRRGSLYTRRPLFAHCLPPDSGASPPPAAPLWNLHTPNAGAPGHPLAAGPTSPPRPARSPAAPALASLHSPPKPHSAAHKQPSATQPARRSIARLYSLLLLELPCRPLILTCQPPTPTPTPTAHDLSPRPTRLTKHPPPPPQRACRPASLALPHRGLTDPGQNPGLQCSTNRRWAASPPALPPRPPRAQALCATPPDPLTVLYTSSSAAPLWPGRSTA